MSENQEEDISHKEFETRLVQLPFQIFLLIAESDDKVVTNEWMAFIKILKEKNACESPYARGVLGKTKDKLQALKLGYERKEIKNDPEEIKNDHEEIKKTLFMIQKRLKQEESEMFEADMEKLADGIADASSKKSLLGRISHASNEQVSILHQMIEEVSTKS